MCYSAYVVQFEHFTFRLRFNKVKEKKLVPSTIPPALLVPILNKQTHARTHLIQLRNLIRLQFKINQIRSEIVIVSKIRALNWNCVGVLQRINCIRKYVRSIYQHFKIAYTIENSPNSPSRDECTKVSKFNKCQLKHTNTQLTPSHVPIQPNLYVLLKWHPEQLTQSGIERYGHMRTRMKARYTASQDRNEIIDAASITYNSFIDLKMLNSVYMVS